jgi:hypothetical protein
LKKKGEFISEEDILKIIHDKEEVKKYSLNTPLYRKITYLLVSLE